jgi:hypothetical protein
MDPAETMRQFALAVLEAADDEDVDFGAMTSYLVERADELDEETMVGISTVAVSLLALAAGVQVRAAAEAIWQAVDEPGAETEAS